MEILNVPRGYGKSTRLIMKAVETGYPIIVGTESMKQYLCDLAERITDKEIKIYSAYEFADIDAMKRDKNKLPLVLSILLNTNVEMATMTSSSLERYGIERYKNRLK